MLPDLLCCVAALNIVLAAVHSIGLIVLLQLNLSPLRRHDVA